LPGWEKGLKWKLLRIKIPALSSNTKRYEPLLIDSNYSHI